MQKPWKKNTPIFENLHVLMIRTDNIFNQTQIFNANVFLLKDRVYTMEAPTAKRGVYPLHGYKLGLYRLPIKLDDPFEIKSVHDGLKNTFDMDIMQIEFMLPIPGKNKTCQILMLKDTRS